MMKLILSGFGRVVIALFIAGILSAGVYAFLKKSNNKKKLDINTHLNDASKNVEHAVKNISKALDSVKDMDKNIKVIKEKINDSKELLEKVPNMYKTTIKALNGEDIFLDKSRDLSKAKITKNQQTKSK